jgi:hypothetical protein
MLLYHYSTTGYFENILYTYRGVYISGKRLPLVLMLLLEHLVFLFIR